MDGRAGNARQRFEPRPVERPVASDCRKSHRSAAAQDRCPTRTDRPLPGGYRPRTAPRSAASISTDTSTSVYRAQVAAAAPGISGNSDLSVARVSGLFPFVDLPQ